MKAERLSADRVEALAAWIAERNARPEDHVAYASVEADAVAGELRTLEPMGPAGVMVLREGGAVAAVMAVESDPELKRAWLWGPWAGDADWDAAADRVFAAALGIVPDGIEELEVAADARNARLAAFAERHGFRPFSPGSRFLSLGRADAAPLLAGDGDGGTEPLDPARYDAFRALHEACFPDRYYEADRLRDMATGERVALLTAVEDDVLAGFAFVQALAPPAEAVLDFLGVDAAFRGRGVGRRLLREAVRFAFGFDDVARLGLTVRNDNAAAIALYDATGFHVDRVAHGWRRPLRAAE